MRHLTLALLVACGSEPVGSGGPEGEVVRLETRDGVTLFADVYPAEPGAPAVVLLHMTPTCCDRTDWPVPFIRQLVDEGWAVIVPDRRGAGLSGGVAEDAFVGEAGRYDVEAAVLHLEDVSGPVAMLGASNGTTSMVDYAAWAPSAGLVEPVALGFLTGGTYTENQTAMGPWLADIPSVFTYSTEERAWSEAQRAHDTAAWSFHEYEDGAHGTAMFEARPEVAQVLVTHLEGAFTR